MSKRTDTERLDALEKISRGPDAARPRYGIGWILRMSNTGRGLRLHESNSIEANPNIRKAIDRYLDAE